MQSVARKWGEATFQTRVGSDRTRGQLSIVETVSRPGSGPPRHVHEREDETFVILSGRMELMIGGRTITAGPGDTVFAPRGVEHAFRVVGEDPCRHLVIFNPGGCESFFDAMIEGQFRIPRDMDGISETAATFGIRFTGPPMAVNTKERIRR